MKKSTSIFITFWIFFVYSLIDKREYLVICLTILAVGYYIVKQLEENNEKKQLCKKKE